jgi:hypothetical protein
VIVAVAAAVVVVGRSEKARVRKIVIVCHQYLKLRRLFRINLKSLDRLT